MSHPAGHPKSIEDELNALRAEKRALEQRALDAEHSLLALARGEIDAVAVAGGSTPILLRAAQDELLRSEQRLRTSEARFRALVEKTTEAISLTSADGTTEYITPTASELLGWTAEEMRTRSMRDQVVPEDRERLEAELARVVRDGVRDFSIEFKVRHRNGSILCVESSGTNLLDDPDVRAIVGNYRDITARTHAEEASRADRRLLEEAQALGRIGSWTLRVSAPTLESCSPECRRLLGLPATGTISSDLLLSRVHPSDADLLARLRDAAARAGRPYDVEHRVLGPADTLRWMHERAVVERDGAGRPQRILASVQDVTERRQNDRARAQSDDRYRRIVENTSEGVWTYDTNGITTFMNAQMVAMLGCSMADSVGQPVDHFITPSRRSEAAEQHERRRQGIAERTEFPLRRVDGTLLWVSIQANPLVDAEGVYEGVLALVTDISAQREVQLAHARLAAIVDSSDDAIVSVDLEGHIATWNLGAQNLYHYEAHEMIGAVATRIVPPELLAEERRITTSAALGHPVRHHRTERYRRDGSLVSVSLTVSPVRDADGEVVGVSKIARDLTDRLQTEEALRRSEEQFRQAQKMEAVGQLAGGVAHDFNNLLSVILGYTEFAAASLAPEHSARDDIEQIRIAAHRAADLTRQLLAFSRRQVLQPRVIALGSIVVGMEAMLGRLLGEDVELLTESEADLGRTLADPGQIEQVIMNLAVNARDAMAAGGRLTIATANVEVEAGAAGPAPAGSYVRLSISDTGAGMDAATRARIFEPFYTTKAQGKGTGLGLSTVVGIVEQSGGHIVVRSVLGRGSTFEVLLPRTERPLERPAPTGRQSDRQGTETVLLVEDEAQVRAVASAILRKAGYRVVEASSGREALALAADFTGEIDLLLTDVVMPRMSGPSVARELATTRPHTKTLFASGYTDDSVMRNGLLEADVRFLQKPFTAASLLAKVREVLTAI